MNSLVTAAATRVLAVAVALLGAAGLGVAGLPGPSQPLCADAAAAHHATVVVSHLGPGYASPVRVCVGFTEDSITGHQLLERSGVQFGLNGTHDLGSEVCQVDREPATYDPNNCLRAGQPYWSVWQAPYRGGWTYTKYGIDGVTIHDGDAEGFRFDQNPGPPDAPGSVCPPPAPAPPPSPRATTSQGAAPPATGAPSTRDPAQHTGGPSGSAATSPAASSPAPAPGASPSDDAQVAALESPPGPGPSTRPPPAINAAPPPDRLGLAVAGVGAVSLLLLLAAQLVLPRLRS